MKKLLLFSFFISFSLSVFAQPSNKTTPIVNTPTPPAPSIPIDGGIGFLVAAGVGYGVSRFRKRKED